ncbi:MAG: uroporphyrinogen-III C-methyltransferase [bacterium]
MSRPLRARREGIVYLVGAGPGDPGLMTVKGLRMLRTADVVVYDALVNPALLEEAPVGSERICVGKRGGGHAFPQDTINTLLIDRARAGSTVVRLKGGDPFVFGRGGEECEALRAAGIPFEIVPGVTSAVAVPAFAGIPVTHRRYASAFAVVTGHECDGASDLDWEALSRLPTLVVLMGLHRLPEITRRLLAHGAHPSTPAAVVTDGTSPLQRTVSGTIASIAALAERASLQPPGVIIVGEVARLHDRLQWFGLSRDEGAEVAAGTAARPHHFTPPTVSSPAAGRRRSGTANTARFATRTLPAMK